MPVNVLTRPSKKDRKDYTYTRTLNLINTYKTILIVDLDNVKATQLQKMVKKWRGDAELLIGKNTVIKKALETLMKKESKDESLSNNDKLENLNEIPALINSLKSNVSFLFTNSDPKGLRQIMLNHSRDTYAKTGQVAQREVIVSKCVTNLGPENTKFFQALDIYTKVTKGKVEILNDVGVMKKGEIVTASEANLLTLLDIKPFTYYMEIRQLVEDGYFYNPDILEIDEELVRQTFVDCCTRMKGLSLGADFVVEETVSYVVEAAYKRCIGLSLGSGYEVEESKGFN